MAPRVLVCRGCCCGTHWKHPETDHERQVRELSAIAQTRVVDCVGECSSSNIVIVRPGDGSTVWFGGILSDVDTRDLRDWIAAGTPNPLPETLAAHRLQRHRPPASPVPVRWTR